jgi:hypothetical protein
LITDILDEAIRETRSYLDDATYQKTYAPVCDELRAWIATTVMLRVRVDAAEHAAPGPNSATPGRPQP